MVCLYTVLSYTTLWDTTKRIREWQFSGLMAKGWMESARTVATCSQMSAIGVSGYMAAAGLCMRAVLTSTSSSRERQRLNMKRKVGNDYRDKRRQGC